MSDGVPLGELLMRAARTLRRGWGGALEPWGLSPHQARALRAVAAEGGLRVSNLASSLRIAPRSATEVVDGLAERGLIERTVDPADRRAVVVRLTEQGRLVQSQIEKVREDNAEQLFLRLREADRADLARILRRLVEEDS